MQTLLTNAIVAYQNFSKKLLGILLPVFDSESFTEVKKSRKVSLFLLLGIMLINIICYFLKLPCIASFYGLGIAIVTTLLLIII